MVPSGNFSSHLKLICRHWVVKSYFFGNKDHKERCDESDDDDGIKDICWVEKRDVTALFQMKEF